ncbi:MAG: sulfate reduction electron transfer complex DsrMKJOP subunit DsrM [Candidatus Electryoneaceae bacterium]|nr:sulfate reduction electron transfer complex DsrMKJOP subunit DsrM [Candidatus Electryoneaceae bacterium]
MRIMFSLFAVLVLIGIAWIGSLSGLHFFFGVIIPYAAILTFLIGVVYRTLMWSKSPVPFRIPTTSGQQNSLPWIKNSPLDNPHTTIGVIGRMFLEIFFFRSLFRNTASNIVDDSKVVYGSAKWLWVAGLAFHYSFLIIVIRHFRFFVEPVPFWIHWAQALDGFFQICLPILYLTDLFLVAAVTYLLLRRLLDAKMRYISLAADYFPLLLILAIGTTGGLMRYFFKVDVIGVKELAGGLFSFSPPSSEVMAGIGVLFFIHLFLVSMLIAYIPFSKLMHMVGVFMSPTRNLANNNRMKRHINPWDYEVKVHTYEEWEDEFREKMADAGMPLEKPLVKDSKE